MFESIVNSVPYPFKFDPPQSIKSGKPGQLEEVTLSLSVRGKIPSIQASRLRSMMLEASKDPSKIIAHACSYDGLSSRLVEEAGFPVVFLAGYAMASSFGLPDTGYIALQEVCDKIQQTVRQVSVPIFADGDTGYGSPMNVKRTVQSFAEAGAAGVMIEDQTWPKRKDIPSIPFIIIICTRLPDSHARNNQDAATPRAKQLCRGARRTPASRQPSTPGTRARTSSSWRALTPSSTDGTRPSRGGWSSSASGSTPCLSKHCRIESPCSVASGSWTFRFSQTVSRTDLTQS